MYLSALNMCQVHHMITHSLVQECVSVIQGHPSKVIVEFSTNQKHLWDFLLACHSKLSPILHRFLHHGLKAYFHYGCVLRCVASDSQR